MEGAKRINLLPSPEVCKEQAYFLGMSETLKKLGTLHLLEQFLTVWSFSNASESPSYHLKNADSHPHQIY